MGSPGVGRTITVQLVRSPVEGPPAIQMVAHAKGTITALTVPAVESLAQLRHALALALRALVQVVFAQRLNAQVTAAIAPLPLRMLAAICLVGAVLCFLMAATRRKFSIRI